MSIGENIRRIRKERGMTQEELAKKVYVVAPMICMIERGTKAPSLQLGKELAEALGVSMEDLFK